MLALAATAAALFLSPAVAVAQAPGDWVLAPWRTGNYVFPGVVAQANGGRVVVRFDDGSTGTFGRGQVRRFNWRAGSRVQCRFNNGDRWYNGRVTAIGRDGLTLGIRYDDGDTETTQTGRCRVQV